MKKFILILFLFLCVGAFFHLEILGAGFRYGLKKKWGADLTYESLHWSGGSLVAEKVSLKHFSGTALIPRVAIHFDLRAFPHKLKGTIQIDSPELAIDAVPTWERGESWVDMRVAIEKGRLDWGGAVQFSCHSDEGGSDLTLDWDQAGLKVVEREGKIEAEFKQFNTHLLQLLSPYGEIKEGDLTGRVSLDEKGLLSANLKLERFSGSLGNGEVREGEATFSYNAHLGAKWELKGVGRAQGKEFPISMEGKGFFNSHWIEGELQMGNGVCRLSGDEDWKVECFDLSSEHIAWMQGGAALYLPELNHWAVAAGALSGSGTFSQLGWEVRFEGRDLVLQKGGGFFVTHRMVGDLTQDGGSLIVESPDVDVKLAGCWDEWSGEARLGVCHLSFLGGWDGEKIPVQIEKGLFQDLEFKGHGWVDPNFDLALSLEGKWGIGKRELSLYCPHFSKEGSKWAFDVRCARRMWDLLRIAGTFDGSQLVYGKVSHFLESPLTFAPVPLGDLDIGVHLSSSQILSLGPLMQEWGFDLAKAPHLDDTDLRFQFKNGKPEIFATGETFQFRAEQVKEGWSVNLQSPLTLNALLKKDGATEGRVDWKKGLAFQFHGKIDPALNGEFALSQFQLDLGLLEDPRFEGKLEGEGHLVYDGAVEADFDLHASSLKLHSYGVENEGKIHFSYSSCQGALFKGVNLHGPFDCQVDLLEYDECHSHWIFHGAQVHLPGPFLEGRYFQLLDLERDLNFTADLDFAADLSTVKCSMQQGIIPFNGADRLIENLHLVWDRGECRAALNYCNHFYRLQCHIDEGIGGRLILGCEETPLTIDWDYKEELSIHSVEGSFSGFEASFHEESPNQLIGSARINFTEFSTLLPDIVAKGFNEVKMGKGFEVKGRVKMKKSLPYFEGILCGKQVELFGFQFRTLLGQIEYSLDRVRIFDTKISDTAGMMKVDEILMQSLDGAPWTIAIPTITVQELRPSLLQRPGGPPGTISPLVVRELKLTDFHGLLADESTYQASGTLHFINSYKREETLFDGPANVLSRIVGLDLELLIPVCGDLFFHLADRRFILTELKNSYSEGIRSQFFLEMNPPPYMDLDWNLEIFIKMKQFVLLKFTESFLISIEGKLNDPKYHLQKRRFFGLL